MRKASIVEFLQSLAILCAVGALMVFAAAQHGCSPSLVTPAADATPSQKADQVRLAAVLELSRAYGDAETLIADLHRAGVISTATATEARNLIRPVSPLLDDLQKDLSVKNLDQFAIDLDAAWQKIDAAARKHSPTQPAPSTLRKVPLIDPLRLPSTSPAPPAKGTGEAAIVLAAIDGIAYLASILRRNQSGQLPTDHEANILANLAGMIAMARADGTAADLALDAELAASQASA